MRHAHLAFALGAALIGSVFHGSAAEAQSTKMAPPSVYLDQAAKLMNGVPEKAKSDDTTKALSDLRKHFEQLNEQYRAQKNEIGPPLTRIDPTKDVTTWRDSFADVERDLSVLIGAGSTLGQTPVSGGQTAAASGASAADVGLSPAGTPLVPSGIPATGGVGGSTAATPASGTAATPGAPGTATTTPSATATGVGTAGSVTGSSTATGTTGVMPATPGQTTAPSTGANTGANAGANTAANAAAGAPGVPATAGATGAQPGAATAPTGSTQGNASGAAAGMAGAATALAAGKVKVEGEKDLDPAARAELERLREQIELFYVATFSM